MVETPVWSSFGDLKSQYQKSTSSRAEKHIGFWKKFQVLCFSMFLGLSVQKDQTQNFDSKEHLMYTILPVTSVF